MITQTYSLTEEELAIQERFYNFKYEDKDRRRVSSQGMFISTYLKYSKDTIKSNLKVINNLSDNNPNKKIISSYNVYGVFIDLIHGDDKIKITGVDRMIKKAEQELKQKGFKLEEINN